jgi:hypothetical protein
MDRKERWLNDRVKTGFSVIRIRRASSIEDRILFNTAIVYHCKKKRLVYKN